MNPQSSLAPLKIRDISIKKPIIQGGMGVGISSFRLASAVSNAGALGVIAAVGASMACPDTELSYSEKSYRGLRKIIQTTKSLTPHAIGVNIMCALSDYDQLVKAAIDEQADIIISGAGLPLHLPALTRNSDTKLIPIVSSVRAASIICRIWKKKYDCLPDALIVEGPEAGGHLGFSLKELEQHPSLDSILSAVLAYIREIEDQYQCKIPVIAAGGIFSGTDIARVLKLGAAGVQMGTRFVCTDECDADTAFKQAYLDCRPEDLVILKSPVGLPLRVIRNSFAREIQHGRKAFPCQYHCLQNCIPAKSPYCIAQALANAANGNLSAGIITCGVNACRVKKIVPVAELINELTTEAEKNRG